VSDKRQRTKIDLTTPANTTWNTVVEGGVEHPLPRYRAAEPLTNQISHPGRGGRGYPVNFSYAYYYNTHTVEIDAFFFLLEYISLTLYHLYHPL
jgi:hypothetical protein